METLPAASPPTAVPLLLHDAEARRKMSNALCSWALAAVPDTPAPGKWTRLWSGLVAVLVGTLCRSFLLECMPLWLQELDVVRRTQNEEAQETELDPALTSTIYMGQSGRKTCEES